MELDPFLIGLLVGLVLGATLFILLWISLRPKKEKKHLWIKDGDQFTNLAQSHVIEGKVREQSIHVCFSSSKTIIHFENEKDYKEELKKIETIILG